MRKADADWSMKAVSVCLDSCSLRSTVAWDSKAKDLGSQEENVQGKESEVSVELGFSFFKD